MDVYTIIVLFFFGENVEIVETPYQFPTENECEINMITALNQLHSQGAFREMFQVEDEITNVLLLCVSETAET